jgi:hypothetical protein
MACTAVWQLQHSGQQGGSLQQQQHALEQREQQHSRSGKPAGRSRCHAWVTVAGALYISLRLVASSGMLLPCPASSMHSQHVASPHHSTIVVGCILYHHTPAVLECHGDTPLHSRSMPHVTCCYPSAGVDPCCGRRRLLTLSLLWCCRLFLFRDEDILGILTE